MTTDTTEQHNHAQIERLNQRGGRTLSIVDLLEAGTISLDMAAYAYTVMSYGASVLTGAVPGGAGKTTLMATMLHALPAGVKIVTVDEPSVIDQADSHQPGEACFLVHEIGAGHWYGYLWGPPVARYLDLTTAGHLIASCLHADTLEELTNILRAPPLSVSPAALGGVSLILFMQVEGGWSRTKRRVATMYEAVEGEHRLLWEWRGADDEFSRVEKPRLAAELAARAGRSKVEIETARWQALLADLLQRGVRDTRAVRREVLQLQRSLAPA